MRPQRRPSSISSPQSARNRNTSADGTSCPCRRDALPYPQKASVLIAAARGAMRRASKRNDAMTIGTIILIILIIILLGGFSGIGGGPLYGTGYYGGGGPGLVIIILLILILTGRR